MLLLSSIITNGQAKTNSPDKNNIKIKWYTINQMVSRIHIDQNGIQSNYNMKRLI